MKRKILQLVPVLVLCLIAACVFASCTKKHVHEYGDWTIVSEANCETDGLKTRACNGCKETEQETIKAKGHNYGAFLPEVSATCETEGTKGHYECSACHKNFDNEKHELSALTVAKIDHRLGAPETIENPTCTNEGKAIKRCANCDYTETITLPKNAHNYVETARTEPTCTEQGNKQTTCDGCGDVQNTALDKLGHTFGDKPQYVYDYLDSTDPELCFKKYRKCRRCSQDVYYMAQSHSLTNDNDRSVAATCTKTGIAAKKCQRCNYLPETQITPIDPTRHVKVVEKNDPVNEATCMERHFGECQDCLTVVWEMGQTSHDYDYSTFECRRNTCSAVHEASIAWFNYSNFNYGFAIKSVKEKSIPELLKYLQKTEGRIRLPERGTYNVTGTEQKVSIDVMASNLFAKLDKQTAALIKYVYVPKGYKRIDENAFANLPSLVEIYLPSTITTMEPRALKGCDTVTRLTLPHKYHVYRQLADIYGIIGSVPNNSALTTLNLHTVEKPDNLTIALNSNNHVEFANLTEVNLLKNLSGNITYTLDGKEFTHNKSIYRNGINYADGIITYNLADRLIFGKE